MHSHQWLLLASLLALAAGLVFIACGESGNGDAGPDLARIATATLPNPLPEVRIVDEVQPATNGTTYAVQAGDTLSIIADQFGTTVEAIIEVNEGVDPRGLVVGQVLIIPGGVEPVQDVLGATVEPTPAPAATPQPSSTEVPSGDCTYTIGSGDISYLIAQSYGITIEELAAINSTTIDDLRSLTVGEELSVPCSP